MCGIIAVLRPEADGSTAPVAALADRLAELPALLDVESSRWVEAFGRAGAALEQIDAGLRGVPGVRGMLADPASTIRLATVADQLVDRFDAAERHLDDPACDLDPARLESTNAALLRCRDALWAVRCDRIRASEGLLALSSAPPQGAGLAVLLSLHQSLSALDRLEVRGRDSAGIELLLTGHGLDTSSPEVAAAVAERASVGFTCGSVRLVDGVLVVVYKVAAEIGELGDNTRALREAIRADPLLAMALAADSVRGVVLGHTRWASIGIVSEPNAHPQCSDEVKLLDAPLATAVLNGDVDNYADLIAAERLEIPAEITTDAKVIPVLHRRAMRGGVDPTAAFLDTVARLEGSVAVGAACTTIPDRMLLALRGSGQALYVGMMDDGYIVASEPYGVVEETNRYLRMDGETPSDPDNPTGSRGQVVELRADGRGGLEGVRRFSFDGSELPVLDGDLVTAQVTTRDIDRGAFPHYLLKEITHSPRSFRTTLRGRLVEQEGVLRVNLGEETLPARLAGRVREGRIQRILVVGQGTAAIAGQSLAEHLGRLVAETSLRVEALPATELSGFAMRADMSDTLVVAISQSGTTTDTNRTVDLVRSRGASVISIVNRRGSDLTDKSDGVLYTSDGRDVEMSVASTKAFYAQVAAGFLLSYALAEHVPGALGSQDPAEQELLHCLRDLPALMERTLELRAEVAGAAQTFAPPRRYWATVGNGLNSITARELRVKLSELCYKSIACDATEDKKHIDLSSEPLIVVSAAGLVGSTADDVAKEVAIFRAHKAAPIVIASEGDDAFGAALCVLGVPAAHPQLAFVLATMVGHLFGYEAALAIDSLAGPLRAARVAIDEVVASVARGADGASGAESIGRIGVGPDVLDRLRPELFAHAAEFAEGLGSGRYDGNLEAGTAVRLTGLLRYAVGMSSLDGYQMEFGKVGTPGAVLDDLSAALTAAIDELTRPVDAIKHQAKTVTVGISRSDESLLHVPLVEATLGTGAGREGVPYSSLRSLADLDPAVERVTGYTRYAIHGGAALDGATLEITGRGGVSEGLRSRVEDDPRLRGTKALVARERELMVARGRGDGRTVVIVPEIRQGVPVGLVLLHVQLADRLPAPTARSVLQGYRRRYQALRDAVTETHEFDDALLADQPLVDLLVVPILDLAERWRR
jgi:glucosamine--fructose-6-phosphate aminotransferase (isomerizing)